MKALRCATLGSKLPAGGHRNSRQGVQHRTAAAAQPPRRTGTTSTVMQLCTRFSNGFTSCHGSQ